MAIDWVKPRPLPDHIAHVREDVAAALRVRVAVLVFVWSFAVGTAAPGLEAASVVVGAVAAAVSVVLYLRLARSAGEARGSAEYNDWLLYRPEPGAPAIELAMFVLLGIGLAVIIVAAVVRIVVG